MYKKILAMLFLILVVTFLKTNVIENAYFNIPTRFCEPTRFTSPMDERGRLDVLIDSRPFIFDQSEAIGENIDYCRDNFER
jgi:hypothetical protein